MRANEIEAILKELDEAFGSLPMPPDDRIVQSSSWRDPEREQIREHFRGRHWQNLSIEEVTAEAEALAFFTPEAFRFFLPAFIRVSLLDPERADLIPDSILSKLAQLDVTTEWEERRHTTLDRARVWGISEGLLLELGKAEPFLDPLCRYRVAILDKLQKDAVRSFVHFLRRHRQDDFDSGDLDRVEEALASE